MMLRGSLSSCACLVAAIACLPAAIVSAQEREAEDSTALPFGAVIAETATPTPPTDWCATFEKWKAKGLLGYLDPGSDCPIQGECDLPEVRDSYLPDEGTPMKVIRVHLLAFRRDDGTDPVTTEEQIIESMQLINTQYEPHRIRFIYTWQWVDDTTYRYGNGNDYQMKQTYAVDPEHRCNIYIIARGSAYGVFPWDPAALTAQGGIVMGDQLWGPPYYALAHEMGHNVGLWHTHHGVSEVPECGECYELADGTDAETTGDFCGQTPPTPVNYTCDPPGGIDPCCGVEWGLTQPENYMGYGLSCWEFFVHQQAGRMHCWVEAVLFPWLTCLGDFDGDGDVDTADLLFLLGAWGTPDGDVDGDGDTDTADLLALLAAWGECP